MVPEATAVGILDMLSALHELMWLCPSQDVGCVAGLGTESRLWRQLMHPFYIYATKGQYTSLGLLRLLSDDIDQAHMGALPLPISDYATDTKSALDNSLRVLQALADSAADAGWLDTTRAVFSLVQALLQVWHTLGCIPFQRSLRVMGKCPFLEIASISLKCPTLWHVYILGIRTNVRSGCIDSSAGCPRLKI